MKKIFSLIIIYFLLVQQSFGTTGVPDVLHWVPAGFGGGGTFSMIIPDNFTPGKVYAVSDVGAPLVSNDNGDNWTWLSYNSITGYSAGVGAVFAQSYNDPNLMYTMGGDNNGTASWMRKLLRSIDGGQTWTIVSTLYAANRPTHGKVISFDPTNDDIAYVSSNTGVVGRTLDRGVTWSTAFNPFEVPITNEAAELNGTTNTRTGNTNSTNNLLRGSFVFTSLNETFTDSALGVNSSGVGLLVGSAGGSGTINYTNGAYTLNFAITPTTTLVSYIVKSSATWIHVNKTGTKVFAGSTKRGLKVWDVATQTITSIPVTSTTVSSYAVHNNAVNDFGTYIDDNNIEHLCVAVGIQIGCTADDGATWTYTSNATSPATYSGNDMYINRMAVRKLANGQIRFLVYLTGFIDDLVAASANAFMRTSSNSGNSWTTSTFARNTVVNPTFVGNTGIVPESLREDKFNENIFYFSSNFTIFRSDNGGISFLEKVKGAQQTVANDIKVTPNGWLIACHMDIGCQKSVDYGVTWVNLIPKYPFSEAGVPYPGGHYWKIVLTGTKEDWDAGNGHIILSSNYWYDSIPRIHRSIDNGANFTTIKGSGLPTQRLFGDCIWGNDGCYFRALDVSRKNENVLYAAMDGSGAGGDGGLFKSIDNGINWSRVWTNPHRVYNALAVDPTDIFSEKLILGTTKYNLYQKRLESENAELLGTGNTRTGKLNITQYALSKTATFTSTSGEIFTHTTSSSTLVSNLGGSGTVNYSTGDYSLTFNGTVSSTTVTYQTLNYVGAEAPPNNIWDAVYDSKGHPYVTSDYPGASVYKSIVTDYGNGTGSYGTWKLMKGLPTSSTALGDGLLIDPNNDNRLFVASQNAGSEMGSSRGNRVFLTVDAQNHTKAIWYDITGDLPSVNGCQALALHPNEGTRGFLYCASPGNDIFKLDLADSPTSTPGQVTLGS